MSKGTPGKTATSKKGADPAQRLSEDEHAAALAEIPDFDLKIMTHGGDYYFHVNRDDLGKLHKVEGDSEEVLMNNLVNMQIDMAHGRWEEKVAAALLFGTFYVNLSAFAGGAAGESGEEKK